VTNVTQISFCRVGDQSSGTPVEAVYAREVTGAHTFTPTSSNQVSPTACPQNRQFCRVATNVDVLVSFGAAPNALTDEKALFMPGGTREFCVVDPGDYVSVVAVS
jgi:hypothetical protein